MTILMSIAQEKVEIARIQRYIELIETYEADTLDMLFVLSYAKTNNIDRNLYLLNEGGYTIDDKPIERDYILGVIKQIGRDELHARAFSLYDKD
ncbi:hypothetical protein [Bacillus weihaiensis]|uniref:Uncharacterized protein n=1 Tax=Bacillus weihaiensis TaxID=1547283 RepID=A0A1L3MVP9_9BACI|nr:hypothetical protein [Bacillus weihaiensis]APH06399.1 hypothetical protein A9C19_17590 [Bacillus weihaiensis]